MKISVVTVTIGRIEKLRECLKSVNRQDMRGVEHFLMVDKKAADGAYEEVRALAASYPNCVLSPTRHDGIFDGWNRAVKEISGDVVMFLGDDDLVIGDRVFSLIKAVFEKHPGHKWVYGDYMLNMNVFKSGPFNYRRLIDFNFMGTMSTYYRRELFAEFGEFNHKDYPHSADYEYSLRIGKKYEAKYIPEVISFFNWSKGSMSFDDNEPQRKETLAMQELYRRRYYEDFQPDTAK